MKVSGFSRQLAHRLVGWMLILAFGPAPFATLFTSSGPAECRMACCKRAHGRHSCDHGDSSSRSPSVGASQSCRTDCSRDAAAPGSLAAGLLPPAGSVAAAPAQSRHMVAARDADVFAVTDPFLYQRPPPVILFA